MSCKNLVLYSYFRSSCAWRVRLALQIKNIPYEYRAVNIKPGEDEQMSEDFAKLNPICQVPVIVLSDGTVLRQSLPIIEYLEECCPEPYLLPRSPKDRARVRALCELIASGIQPFQNIGLLQNLPADERVPWAAKFITKGFVALEKQLKETAGKYCFGDELTMADCCLVPQVYNARKFKVDMTMFPTITRIDKTLNELEPFKKAHADNQPDTPESEKPTNW